MNIKRKSILVGERTNINGSEEFRRLILEERFDEAVEIGERQIKDGAAMLDICFISSEDEKRDMRNFLLKAVEKTDTPFMLDSLSQEVIEESLKTVNRKCVINSVNLRGGEQRLKRTVELALRYKAAVVVSSIDETPGGGMAVKWEKKLEVAKRSCELLSGKYNLDPSNIIIDPLLFPVSSSLSGCDNPAEETIEGLRRIKYDLPQVRTLIGLSNISFGLPFPARRVLDSVFLYHCEKAGLEFAITDPGKLKDYQTIVPSLKSIANDVIFSRGVHPLEKFLDRFAGGARQI